MCIFCGGQCGGLGEFLISIGLPFLGFYVLRMKGFLVKLKKRILGQPASEAQLPRPQTPGESAACQAGATLVELPVPRPLEILPEIIKFADQGKTQTKEGPRGVKGWLLLFCLILTIVIPASYLYKAMYSLDFIYFSYNVVPIIIYKKAFFYHALTIVTLTFLSAFSFYAGLKLWEVKPGAVKITKAYLFTQLFATYILVLMRPFMAFWWEENQITFGSLAITLIASTLHFTLWYLYLDRSKRISHTYSQAGAENPNHGRFSGEFLTSGFSDWSI